tara:strand:- start:4161 stop:4334 length:174 start_codon:yes stop_codon:yes gene_type:complete
MYSMSEASVIIFPELSERAAYMRFRRIVEHGNIEIHKAGKKTYISKEELKRLGANLN